MIYLFPVLTFFIWAYLKADAIEDAHMKKRGINIDHRDNAVVRCIALLGMITLSLVMQFTLNTALYRILLICALAFFYFFAGWWFFDRAHNRHSGVMDSHVGSGKIDSWFKRKYGTDAYAVMLKMKYMGMGIGFILMLLALWLNDDLI